MHFQRRIGEGTVVPLRALARSLQREPPPPRRRCVGSASSMRPSGQDGGKIKTQGERSPLILLGFHLLFSSFSLNYNEILGSRGA
jgi:hypothetical protein